MSSVYNLHSTGEQPLVIGPAYHSSFSGSNSLGVVIGEGMPTTGWTLDVRDIQDLIASTTSLFNI